MMRVGDYCSRVPAVSGAGRGPRGGEGERGPEHLSSEGGVTVELRLAGRMGLLGTGTAVEGLAGGEGRGGGGRPAPAPPPPPPPPPTAPGRPAAPPPQKKKPIMFFAMLA